MFEKNKAVQVLTSRKFWAAVAALAFAFFGARAGLDEETVKSALQVLIAYIIGQGLADIRAS